MFSENLLRKIALGTSIGVATLGAATKASADNLISDNLTTSETKHTETISLNTSTNITKNKGPLSGTFAPKYDGPVKWAGVHDAESMGLLLGSLAAIIGAGCVAEAKGNLRQVLTVAASSGLIVGGLTMAYWENYSFIQFDTKVQELVVANPPHQEMRRHGKINRLEGPFFTQVLSIPETDLLLSANNLGSPFLHGQKIKATFIVDSHNHIVSWVAVPGAR